MYGEIGFIKDSFLVILRMLYSIWSFHVKCLSTYIVFVTTFYLPIYKKTCTHKIWQY